MRNCWYSLHLHSSIKGWVVGFKNVIKITVVLLIKGLNAHSGIIKRSFSLSKVGFPFVNRRDVFTNLCFIFISMKYFRIVTVKFKSLWLNLIIVQKTEADRLLFHFNIITQTLPDWLPPYYTEQKLLKITTLTRFHLVSGSECCGGWVSTCLPTLPSLRNTIHQCVTMLKWVHFISCQMFPLTEQRPTGMGTVWILL